MKTLLPHFCLFAIATFTSTLAFAVNAQGKIVGLNPPSSVVNGVLIALDNMGTPIACNTTGRYVISTTAIGFKETYAALLTAYAMGKPVYVMGANNCDVWGNSETVRYVCVGSIPC